MYPTNWLTLLSAEFQIGVIHPHVVPQADGLTGIEWCSLRTLVSTDRQKKRHHNGSRRPARGNGQCDLSNDGAFRHLIHRTL